MRTLTPLLLVALNLVALNACSDDTNEGVDAGRFVDAGISDVGRQTDAGSHDAGNHDSGDQMDAGNAIDAGNADSGPMDVGNLVDAGNDECEAFANLFGINVSAGSPDYLDDVQAMGARWIRVEVRPNAFPLSHYRTVAEMAHERGVKVLFLVGYFLTSPKPAWNDSDSLWAAYRQRFAVDLRRAAEALGDIGDAFEVWNEPDHRLNGDYDPGVPSHQFGLLLAESSETLRDHTAAPLVIGGMATDNFAYLTEARNAAGGTLDYDGLGVHTYGPAYFTPATTRQVLDTYLSGWYEAGQSIPLWLTEAGAVAGPEDEQHAVEYVNALFTHVWAHHRDKVFSIEYFSWSDVVGFAGERFGLVRADGTRKPSFDEYRRLSDSCGEL